MPINPSPYIQYGGLWTASQQADAKAAGTWPVPPVPYLYTWGIGTDGRIGDNATTDRSSPVQIGSLTTWLEVAAGYSYFSASIKTDGTLWTWGQSNVSYGQLGLDNTTNYSSPKQVGALTNWSKIQCGGNSMLALKTDGTIWSWGNGADSQLGLGNTTSYSSPKQIGSLTN